MEYLVFLVSIIFISCGSTSKAYNKGYKEGFTAGITEGARLSREIVINQGTPKPQDDKK
jgi:hypothetical protein